MYISGSLSFRKCPSSNSLDRTITAGVRDWEWERECQRPGWSWRTNSPCLCCRFAHLSSRQTCCRPNSKKAHGLTSGKCFVLTFEENDWVFAFAAFFIRTYIDFLLLNKFSIQSEDFDALSSTLNFFPGNYFSQSYGGLQFANFGWLSSANCHFCKEA